MKAISLLFGLAATLLLNGCIGVLPIPPNSETPAMYSPITSDQTKFIVPGRTTREEVIAYFGDAYRESPREPVMAYSWEKPAWGWATWFFFITPAGIVSGGDYEEGSDWRALFLKYDFAGRVEKTEFARLDTNRSLDEQLEAWGWGTHKSFLEDGGGVFNPDTGTPLIFDWMKSNLEVVPLR
jgi:hypothetical protein